MSFTCDGTGRYGTCFQLSLALLLPNKVAERKTICKSRGLWTDYRCKNRYGCCCVGKKYTTGVRWQGYWICATKKSYSAQQTTPGVSCSTMTTCKSQPSHSGANNTAGNSLALITTDTVLSCSPALVMEPFGKVTPHYLAKVCQEFLSGCY